MAQNATIFSSKVVPHRSVWRLTDVEINKELDIADKTDILSGK